MRKAALTVLLLLTTVAAQQRQVDRSRFATAWNDIEACVERLNVTRGELGENMKLYAPWHVASEPKQLRRRELYKAAALDAELMAKRYRELSDLER